MLVAVSGGADSLALLLLAHAALGDRAHAATVDHGLRAESAGEVAYVARLCADRGIPHASLKGDIPKRVERTANLSSRARALRYRLLEAHADAIGARHIATAHHADDQLETLVMRLNRGAGVAGLASIRAVSGRVIRPLLDWRRAELAAIVAQCGIVPVDDPTNRDDRFDRARLRKTLAGADWIDRDRAALSVRYLADAEDALAWATDLAADRALHLTEGEATLAGVSIPDEIRRRLVERCVRHVDPFAECRGPAIARVIAALEGGEQVMLGAVLCSVARHPLAGAGEPSVWRFVPAPPRRAH